MKILLAAATEMEIGPFQKLYAGRPSDFQHVDIDFLITGVGLMATAARLGARLSTTHYDLAIQAGIAGAVNPHLVLGGVYRVGSDLVADLGVMENNEWKDLFDMGFAHRDVFPFEDGRLMAPSTLTLATTLTSAPTGPSIAAAQSTSAGTSSNAAISSSTPSPASADTPVFSIIELPVVSAVTINEITTTATKVSIFKTKYKADIESMEGAAFHFVCIENNVPFIQLRAVSNYVGERDKANWKIKEAVINLNDTLETFIKG
jgi:futalosine hydrolase